MKFDEDFSLQKQVFFELPSISKDPKMARCSQNENMQTVGVD